MSATHIFQSRHMPVFVPVPVSSAAPPMLYYPMCRHTDTHTQQALLAVLLKHSTQQLRHASILTPCCTAVVEAQNDLTQKVLAQCETRDQFK